MLTRMKTLRIALVIGALSIPAASHAQVLGKDQGPIVYGHHHLNTTNMAAQKKFYEDRASKGIAAPGEGPDIFNIVAEWDDNLRFRHLADGLAKAGWTSAQIDKALGGNLLRLYGEAFG